MVTNNAAGRHNARIYPPGGPMALRIKLGVRLRRLRETAGLTRSDAGRAIRASESKISRLELGRVGLKARDVEDLLMLYRVPGSERSALLTMAAASREPGWWRKFGDVLPDWLELYVGLEEAATFIRTYEIQFVPGLLQTEAYAWAVTSMGRNVSPTESERRVELRMARQRILTGPVAPRLWAVVDEAVLRRPIGGVPVMRAQIVHLIELIQAENIVVQIVPFARGGHSGAGGAFTILRFSEPDVPDVVYLEQLESSLYLDRREDVDGYMEVMDRLSVEAQPAPQTARILESCLKDLQ